MSGSGTLALEQAILGHTLAFAPMVAPSQVYVALDLADPAVPPSEAALGTEASGAGYARQPATFALIATPANIAANTATIEFPIAGSAWGTIGWFELWDAPVGGNRLYWGQLIDPATELPITVAVAAGDVLRFSPGALAVQAATGTGGTGTAGAYLPLAGGTLTGPLLLAADPTTYLDAATKQYVDAHSGTGGGPGFLPLSGGTMLGTLTLAADPTTALGSATKQYVDAQVGAYLPLSGGTIAGNLVVNGALSGTAFGKAPGLVPLFENFHGSGVPSLSFPSYLIIDKAGATTSTDFATLNITRTTTHTSGTNNVVASLYAGTTVATNAPEQEVGVLGQVSTVSTTGAAAAIGVWGQSYRTGSSISNLWGLLGNTSDRTGAASSALAGAISTGEFGMRANAADDAVNASKFGGHGARQLLQVGVSRWNQGSTDFVEASSGIWFVSGQQSDDPTKNTFLQTIGCAVGTQMYQFLDARGGAVPSGYTDPFCAVRMSHEQIIDFNGGTALKSGAGNYLQYTSSGTARLRYMVGTNERYAITDAGQIIYGVVPANYANDAAAATGGVPVGGLYRNASQLMVRVT